MTSRVNWLGVEAPAVTAMRFLPLSHAVFNCERSSMRTAGTFASSCETCTRRFVLLLREIADDHGEVGSLGLCCHSLLARLRGITDIDVHFGMSVTGFDALNHTMCIP